MMKKMICALVLLSGCSPNSSGDFQREGAAHCRKFAQLLSQIESREHLLAAEPQLKKQFESLVTLMIAARRFQEGQSEEDFQESVFEQEGAQEELQQQLRRMYAIEGGREVVERAQREAMIRLDAHERALFKKRGQLR